MKQPEALHIAHSLDAYPDALARVAAAELVRLHEANQAMLEALKNLLVEGEFNDYPNTSQWKAALAAIAAIAKGEQQ
jgi:hypothetical protein